ncbi:hypothetical protein SDC9_122736 [bioreactor metagenome]|uniref:Uncharacterized protein n=1 Tax=bioreactor metagenome TaxID=1076179 RepID=A0A645CFX0_9ZZZZ
MDALISYYLPKEKKYHIRNVLYSFQLQNKKIISAFRLSANDGFWSGIFASDQIGIIRKKKQSEATLDHTLPGNPFHYSGSLPDWLEMRTRVEGQYLVPLKCGLIVGNRYTPVKSEENPVALFSLFSHYRMLAARDEDTFLRKLAMEKAAFTESVFQRLAERGEFRYPFTASQKEWYWHLLSRQLSIGEKRFLLEEFSRNNFHTMNQFYENSLKDEAVYALAGRIWVEMDRSRFEQLMESWLENEELWPWAIKQSEHLTESKICLDKMIKLFKSPSQQIDVKYFIPALCASFPQGSSEIKAILTAGDSNKMSLDLYNRIADGIYRTSSSAYTNELLVFLKNNRDNLQLKQSIAYPKILLYLHRANCQSGNRLLIEYLEGVNRIPDSIIGQQFLILFRNVNPLCLSLDDALSILKTKSGIDK